MANEAASAATGNGGGEDDGDGLIFQWERRARSHWRLALMLAASVLVHAVSFYALQVAYTPTGTQLPPPAQVVLVPLDQPENASLARWLTMNDPALTTRPAAPTASQVLGSLGFRYVPSYDAAQPPFKPLDPTENIVNAVPPRANLPGPVPVPPPVVTVRTQAREVGRKTRVVFNGPVEMSAGAPLPPVRFVTGEGTNVLDPAVFLVGLRPEGSEPFVFRQSTSGSAAADEYARGYLAGLGLRPAAGTGAGVTWGRATFYWGNDVYR